VLHRKVAVLTDESRSAAIGFFPLSSARGGRCRRTGETSNEIDRRRSRSIEGCLTTDFAIEIGVTETTGFATVEGARGRAKTRRYEISSNLRQ
jgi:hypothetical protein